MKKLFSLSVLFILLIITGQAQSVAINTDGTMAHSSAILDIKSTTKGMLMPRMTTAQRNAIVSPALGLIVFDTNTKTLWIHNGNSWVDLNSVGGGASFTLPFGDTANTVGAAFHITNKNGGAIEGYSTNGSGLKGYSNTGTGVNAMSSNGFGIIATSVNSGAIYAFNNNTIATIRSTNTTGVAISASSTADNGIFATTNGAAKAGVRGESSVANSYGVMGINSATNGIGVIGYGDLGTGVYAQSSQGLALIVNGNLRISGGNTSPASGKVLTSDATGNATWQYPTTSNKIAFKIHDILPGGSGVFLNNTLYKVYFEDEEYDYGNNITVGNTVANSAFTAPVAGVYHFDASIEYGDFGIEAQIVLIKIATNGTESAIARNMHAETLTANPGRVGDGTTISVSSDTKLLPGEKVIIKTIWYKGYHSEYEGGTSSLVNVEEGGHTKASFFSGHLVFAD